jgi:signal transduction histidine kinase
MAESNDRRRRAAAVAAAGLAAAISPVLLLVLVRPYRVTLPAALYLPVHTALEVLVAAAGISTFAVQWFAAGGGAFREARARFIGPAFLAASILEIAHLLSFPGMPGFFGAASTERGIAYWLAARATTVGALLVAVGIGRKSESPLLRRWRLLALNLLFVLAVVAVELAIPEDRALFFVEGRGLTPLKVLAEATIGIAALTGAVLHARRWWRRREPGSGKLAVALALTVMGESCFMLYAHPYDPFNVIGHVYLVVSFWYVFDALFVAALVRPYHELDALRSHVEDELVVTIRRLRATTEQREDLLRAVSHDLRNPLQIVTLQGQRLLRDGDPERTRRPAGAILTAARRMDRMLRDLADSARADGGRLELSVSPVDLRPFVGDLLELSAGVLDATRVENAVPGDLPPVMADPDRLDRILANLVGNALKYSPDRVVVRAESNGSTVNVTVSDRGAGIDDADLPRIFERYYRGQRHEGEGLGLGLYIVRKLVEAHGGTIWAESRPGEGSTFTFTLPAVNGS